MNLKPIMYSPLPSTDCTRTTSHFNTALSIVFNFGIVSSSETGEEVGKGALIGGALGAAAGATIGAAAGNAGKGAAIGAAVGGIGGGGIMGWNTSESYKEVFRSCMKNRGHTVLN